MQRLASEGNGVTARPGELAALRQGARQLELGAPRRVHTPLAGPYLSPFRGRGLDFEEVRGYQPGDDVRHIDWRVTARTGRAHSKVFHEERDRPLWLLLDAGPSMHFGTRRAFKSVAAARAAALLAWAAQLAGDPLGGLAVSWSGLSEIPAGSGERHLMDVLAAFARATEEPGGDAAAQDGEPANVSVPEALLRLRRRARSGSRVFVLSDFYGFGEEWRSQLSDLGRRCDLSCVLVYDALEAAAPPSGRYRVSDGRSTRTISTGGGHQRAAWSSRFEQRRDELSDFCRSQRIELLPLRTDVDSAEVLAGSRHPRRRMHGRAR